MKEIILGLIKNEKVISLEEIIRRTNFGKEFVLGVLSSLASEGKIVLNLGILGHTSCKLCPIYKSCKVRRDQNVLEVK
ncbi:MAG: hypothetical protein ACUVRG_08295 [Ignavibacterium sp.]|uniref:hypothetical protein n=1 Tax=Ignavibacterium sp. TaxID=2651167 RepID=UPI00404AC2D1